MTARRSLLTVPLFTGLMSAAFVSAADPEPTSTSVAPPVSGPVDQSKPPTTRPTLAQERATFLKSIQEEFSALPEKPDTKIGNILSMEVDDGLLVVQPK